jgi:prepilin-type N-terminal cleavage/methylation domain-containing protein
VRPTARSGFTRSGFTLIELVVALFVSGVVLLGARLILESLANAEGQLHGVVSAADRRANGERLLRALFARLEVGTDQAREFGGDERAARFTTWCDVPSGWLERCEAQVAIDTEAGALALVARLSTGERIVLQRGFGAGALRYLNAPAGGGQWFRVWGHGITAPLAVGVITDGDTVIVRIGERG